MSFPAYKGCKDSGIEKLGEVPLHWEVNQLRRGISFLTDFEANCSFSDMAKNTTFDKGEPFAWLVRATDLENRRYGICEGNRFCGEQTYKFLRKTSLHGGEFLVTKRGEIGKIYVVPDTGEPATLGPNLYLIKLNDKLDPEFAFYWFKGSFGNRQLKIRNQSTTIGALYKDDLRDCICVMPPPEEQKQIASFLDYETAKIDALIEKQQQLIALLGEKRQAVISHAVTKGLNPDAPMRDSGVEWLGQVPEHWEMTWLKHTLAKQPNAFVDGPFGSNLKSEHFVEDGTVFVVESGFATSGRLVEENLKRISEKHFATISRSEACAGDIIIAKIGARYGMSSILPRLSFKAVVSGNSLKLTVDAETMNVDYSHAFLQVLKSCAAMDDGVNVTAQPALSLGGLKNLLFLRPPLDEQAAIVTELNVRRNKLDALISAAFAMSELLQERRSALISAAVTGKIDVRGWKPPSSAARLETEMEVA